MVKIMKKGEKYTNKTTSQDKEILAIFAEIIAKNRDSPFFVNGSDKINELHEIIKKDETISKRLTEFELFQELFNFSSKLIGPPPKDENDISDKFTSFIDELKIEKKYTSTIIFRQLFDIPIGTKLGDLEIIKPDLSINILKEHLEIYGTSLDDVESVAWGRLCFNSYSTIRIEDILFEKLELPLGILSLIMRVDLDPIETLGLIQSSYGTTYLLGPSKKPMSFSRYIPKIHAKQLKLISKTTLKNNQSKLEKKILQAIQIFSLSRLAHKSEIRFLMIITSCESLLLSSNDRDYLGLRLSEKTAYLLETKGEKRFDLFNLMKKLYTKRSKFIHSGINNIERDDVKTLDYIFEALVFKLLELTATYKKMEQKSNNKDTDGVEDHLNNLKFNLPSEYAKNQ